MYISKRGLLVRHCAVAAVNGTITLILLLIAPLGLLAVIVNTVLVTLSTFVVGFLGDVVVMWVSKPTYLPRPRYHNDLIYRDTTREIERGRED